jgi:GH25 family lysozyme M1 (1,4-beta-N-acetylmuramidase)
LNTPIFDDLWEEVVSRRDPEHTTQFLASPGLYGLDTSSWQGNVQWSPVAASGHQFVYVKASEGASLSYPTLDEQYQGALAAGMTVGLYHYADPTLSPQANADAFAAQINRLGATVGHLPPALDLEVGTGNLSHWCQQFITELRQQINYLPVMVYSDASFFANQIGEAWMDDHTILWIASFNNNPGHPSYMSSRVAIHQFSQSGQVPGVAGDVDLDFAIWPLSQLIGDVDLTPQESQMLTDIHNALPVLTWLYGQFAGLGPDGQPAAFPTVPGWETLAGGTNQHLSLLDFLRQSNVQLAGLTQEVQNILAGSGAVDTKALAEQIVAGFVAKLQNV